MCPFFWLIFNQIGMPLAYNMGHVEDDVNCEHYTGKIKADMPKIGRVKIG